MKYVAVSDTHLGQQGTDGSGQVSLLSSKVSNNKINDLSRIIKDFAGGDQVTLVGVGDIMDLSLSYMKDAMVDLNDLISSLNVNEFIYVPGNHDHHIWSIHCENMRVVSQLKRGAHPMEGSIYKATPVSGEYSDIFTIFLQKPTTIAYPTYQIPNKSIYFTHGHLFGGLYTFTSDVFAPFMENKVDHEKTVATINVALIEFIYWLLGETGAGMGADGIMEAIYADSQKGKKSLLYNALKSAIEIIMPKSFIWGFPDKWEKIIVRWVGTKIIDNFVKEPKPITSMDRYMDANENQDLAREWASKTKLDKRGTIITGHTHNGYSEESNKYIDIFNLGSWLITPTDPEPDCKVLLIVPDGITQGIDKFELIDV